MAGEDACPAGPAAAGPGDNVTPQRACIFPVLRGNEAHPGAEPIPAAAPREMPMMRCGKVRDVCADFTAVKVPPERRQGVTVGHAEVVFRSLCADCQVAAG